MNSSIKRVSTFVSLCFVPAAVYSLPVHSEQIQFDTEILKSRGLDTSLGSYFSENAKFTPGKKSVSLTINGEEKGTVTATFGSQGELCINRTFLQSAGLKVPSFLPDEDTTNDCYDYKQAYPTTVITPLPGEERLSLVVPSEALAQGEINPEYANHGGNAGILNYSLITSQSSYGNNQSRYDQLALEDGINIRDWLLRSRQMVTRMDGKMNTDSLYTYIQHTFESHKLLMQAGQVNISNTLFAGASIDGLQFIPENGLTDYSSNGVTVTGIASTAQARVEVKQGGSVVYSTLVPAGAFALENVPVVSLSLPVDVSVIETNGSQSHYTIPVDALSANGLTRPQGLSFAVGRTQDAGDNDRQPFLATMSDGWHLSPRLNAGAGIMLAEDYNALAAQADFMPADHVTVATALRTSMDSYHNKNGHSGSVRVDYNASRTFTLSASATRYSSGYRELTDTLYDDFTQYSGQYSANASLNLSSLGIMSLGYSVSKGTGGANDSRYFTASWGKTFPWATVSVNWQKLLNQTDEHYDNNNNYGDMLYVNVSVPIGSQNVSAYTHRRGDDIKNGLSTSGNLTKNSYYTLSAEQDKDDGENSFSGSINSNLHYTQLGLNASKEGHDSHNSSLTLNGGMVAHHAGLTFSPYSVDDTFAIASVGDKVSGIEINTPEGIAWTDHWGNAVVPNLPAYRASRVEMNTETLPKNIDVNNGISIVSAGRGSVSDIKFSVLNVRRVMLKVNTANGMPLDKNTTIADGDGKYITTVVDDGLVYLNDADNMKEIYAIKSTGEKLCRIDYKITAERDNNVLFEESKGICK